MRSTRIFSILLCGICVMLMYYGWDMKTEFSYEPLGPKPFPLIALALIALGSIALFFFQEETHITWPSFAIAMRMVAWIAGFLLFAYCFEVLGFLLSCAGFVLLTALLFRASLMQALLCSVLCSGLSYYLFDTLMQITLPLGQIFS